MMTHKRVGRGALQSARLNYERANAQLARALATLEDFTSAAGLRRLGVNRLTVASAFHDLDVATSKAQVASARLAAAQAGYAWCRVCNDEGSVPVHPNTWGVCPTCNGESK